jgi:hypothetical protein
MTCIVYDGKELAFDNCATRSIDDDGQLCESCNSPITETVSVVDKFIFGEKDSLFYGEPISIMVGYGSARTCTGIMNLLNKNIDLKTIHSVIKGMFLLDSIEDSSVLIITHKSHYVVSVNHKSFKIGTQQLPIILGCSVAELFMNSYNIQPRIAVALSATHASGIGLGVTYWKNAKNNKTLKKYPNFKGNDRTKFTILKHLDLRNPDDIWKPQISTNAELHRYLYNGGEPDNASH